MKLALFQEPETDRRREILTRVVHKKVINDLSQKQTINEVNTSHSVLLIP